MTPRILLGMESYSVLMIEGLMDCHSSFKAVASWRTLFGFGERLLTIRPRISHRFSIGFKSGLRDGHWRDRMPAADLKSTTFFARWGVALSSWNTQSDGSPHVLRAQGSRWSSRTCLYVTPFTDCRRITSSDWPVKQIAPQTWTLPPPKAVVPTIKLWSSFSDGLRQTLTLASVEWSRTPARKSEVAMSHYPSHPIRPIAKKICVI